MFSSNHRCIILAEIKVWDIVVMLRQLDIKKVLIGILFFAFVCASCKPSKPCILDCHLESDEIIVILNSRYRIGEIHFGAVGDVEFSKYHTDNYSIDKDEETIKIKIQNNQSIFEDGVFYKIKIEWYGGWVESLSKFENGIFIFENEEFHHRGPF